MNSQQDHLFLNFISRRNWFFARLCGFVCCHVWSEPQRNHSEPLRLSRGSIQPSTSTLNNSYSSTAVASEVGRVQGQFLHAFKNATEKKRKDKSLLPLLWSSWCHWRPVLPHKFEYFEQVFKKKTRWRNSETTKCENGSRSIFESSVHLYMLKKRQINKKKKNAEGKQDKQWKYQRHLPLKNPLYQFVYFPICEERVCWFFTPAVTNDSDGSLMEDEFWIWPFTKIVCF